MRPLTDYTEEYTHCEGVGVVYGAKAADLYDPCVAPEMSEWSPTPTPFRHTCDSESNYLPLANLLISHTFPIMVRTFPAFHKKRSIMYQARSHRKKINHKPTQISLLCAGYAGSMKMAIALSALSISIPNN